MATSELIPVRWPRPGESLVFRPVEPAICWFRLHTYVHGERPCLIDGCPECGGGSLSRRASFHGFLAGYEIATDGRPLIVRLTPAVALNWPESRGFPADLRQWELRILRDRTQGRPRLLVMAIRLIQADLPPFVGPSVVPARLLHHWNLPAGDPAYRRAVFSLDALSWPRKDATPILWQQAAAAEGGEV
jgi:hypothetical protein